MELNGKKVDLRSFSVEDVDPCDYPDFCDAHLVGGCFEDGTPLTDEEMDQFNEENPDLVWEMAYDSLH